METKDYKWTDFILLIDANLIWKNTNKTLKTNPTSSNSPLTCWGYHVQFLKNSKKLIILNNYIVAAIDTTKMTYFN